MFPEPIFPFICRQISPPRYLRGLFVPLSLREALECDYGNMVFYAVMDDGNKYCYKGGDRLDVTDQVHSAPDKRHVHIIIDGLGLPKPYTVTSYRYRTQLSDLEANREPVPWTAVNTSADGTDPVWDGPLSETL